MSIETIDPDTTIEDEEKDSTVLVSEPWDPADIRITTKNFSIREVYTQIDEGELDLAPDFQRSFVWKTRQQVRLVESILLGIPLPAFYFNQDEVGSHQVIDGVQRLTTIKYFMGDLLRLDEENLEYLKPFASKVYSTLDPATRRRFAGTQIVAHVIEPQTPDDVKYDIFNRVNTGGSPLRPQEIRHCMSKAQSRNFLIRLVESKAFDAATGSFFWTRDKFTQEVVRDNHRMDDREMALRFCAFFTVPVSEYAKSSSLDTFLLDFTRRIDRQPNDLGGGVNLELLENAFRRAMINCHAVLGDAAFRRWPLSAARRGPLNRAIFESQALALAAHTLEQLQPRAEQIRQAFRRLFDDRSYDDAVRSGTGDPNKVLKRLNAPREALAEILK